MAVTLDCSVGERDYIDHGIWITLEIYCFQQLQPKISLALGSCKPSNLKMHTLSCIPKQWIKEEEVHL